MNTDNAHGRQGSLLRRLAGPLSAARLPLEIAPDALVNRSELTAPIKRIVARTDRPVINTPFVLDPAGQSFIVPPATVRQALTVPPGTATLQIKQSALHDFVQAVATHVARSSRDAQVSIANGKATLVPEQTGRRLDQVATLAAISQSLAAGQMSATGTVMSLHPRVTSTDLQLFVTKTQVIYPDGHVRTLTMTSDYQPAPLSILTGTG